MRYNKYDEELNNIQKLKPYVDGYSKIIQSIEYLKNLLDSSYRNSQVSLTLSFPNGEYCSNEPLGLQLSIKEALSLLENAESKQKAYLIQNGIQFD